MSQKFNKRMYSFSSFYGFIKDAMRTIKYLIKAKKAGTISDALFSRIMLAVTEVNGCEMCAYYHTSEALKNGMSGKDISTMLGGNLSHVPESESIAIYFAQHYADSKGKPTKEAWQRVIECYGRDQALAILGATRAIMVGNTHGIAFGALKNRLSGKPVEKSSLGYEVALSLGGLLLIPVAMVHALIESASKKPLFHH